MAALQLNLSDILIDQDLKSELKRLELASRRLMTSDFVGNYRSAFRGSGLIFSDLREYVSGDDIRNIHWKASARTDRIYVKSYEEERSLTVLLCVDVSNSTAYGAPKSKNRKILELSALLSLLAKGNRDSIGLCVFSDKVEDFIPPSRRRGQVEKVLMNLLKPRELVHGTNIAQTLKFLSANLKRRSLIFIISDFLSPNFEDELKGVAFKHDVVCAMVEDNLDYKIPRAGLVEFIDSESNRRFLFDTGSLRARNQLTAISEERSLEIKALCDRTGADYMRILDNLVRPLVVLMNQRVARLR